MKMMRNERVEGSTEAALEPQPAKAALHASALAVKSVALLIVAARLAPISPEMPRLDRSSP